MSEHDCRLTEEIERHNLPNPFMAPDWDRAEVERWAKQIGDHCPIDLAIARDVRILSEQGVETYESCEGGPGHTSRYGFIHFHGGQAAGLRAVAIALTFGLKVRGLSRVWRMEDRELTGPTWRMAIDPSDPDWRHGGACWDDAPNPSAVASGDAK